MTYDLEGKVALITGAASKLGIGSAVALKLAQDGADVAVVDLHGGPDPRSAEGGLGGVAYRGQGRGHVGRCVATRSGVFAAAYRRG